MQQPRVITALITPFSDRGVDLEGLQENIEEQLQQGVDGLLVLGTTGESPTLSSAERRCVIETAVKRIQKRVPLFVGTGTNATQSTIALTQEAEKLGADAALLVTPYYNRPMQEGIYAHFAAISQASSLPLCVYNIPKRTGQAIDVATLVELAKLPTVIGIKEATGDLGQFVDLLHAFSKEEITCTVWCGDDTLTLPMMSLGAHGVVSVASNLVPQRISQLVAKAAANDFTGAKKDFLSLLPLFKALTLATNPIPIKAAMQRCHMKSGPCRLPLTALDRASQKELEETLEALALQQMECV